MKFAIPYVNWMEDPDHGFIIKDAWDEEQQVNGTTGKLVLFSHWRKILDHALVQDDKGRFRYTTVILSAPKKSGKSVITASIVAWYAEQAPDGSEIYVCANSQDQSARIIFGDLSYHYKHSNSGAKVMKDRIILPNETTIYILTKNFTSNAGGRHALVVWDESWGMTSEDDYRRWDELTPIPTIPHSLRIVSSYAGFYGESKLLHDVYLEAVGKEEDPDGQGDIIQELDPLPCYHNGSSYFAYWDHMPRMPFQTEEYYSKQIETLRASAFLRLHENRWVSSNESFIPIELWDEAASKLEQSADYWDGHPYKNAYIYVAVDMGWKHDHAAAIGIAMDSDKGVAALVFNKIWKPVEGDILSPEVIEQYIRQQASRYRIAEVIYDPTQLVQAMAKLRFEGLPTSEFSQNSVDMIAGTDTLYSFLRNGKLLAYQDPDIKDHMRNAIVEHSSRGMRVVKDKGNRRLSEKKVDSVVALVMAIARAAENVDMKEDNIVIESRFGDFSAWKQKQVDQSHLPRALRTDIY
jgi:phage terminase large subunit-like protein